MATDGNNSYVAWQADTEKGFSPIFLSISNNKGENYFAPLELTRPEVRNSSELQVATVNNSVFIVWQETNTTSGSDSIFIASSMSSNEFKTYQLNTGDSTARSPKLFTEDNDIAVVWTQRNFDNSTDCGGGNAEETSANQTTVGGSGNIPDILCAHRRPW